MATHSLSTRLLASVSILLIIFFGITIVLLDVLFRDLSDRAMHERLELQLRTLISASEEDSERRAGCRRSTASNRASAIPDRGCMPRFCATTAMPSWRSDSLAGTGLEFPSQLQAGVVKFTEVHSADGSVALAAQHGNRMGVQQQEDAAVRLQRGRESRAVLCAARSVPRAIVRGIRRRDAAAAGHAGRICCVDCSARCAVSSRRSKRSKPAT